MWSVFGCLLSVTLLSACGTTATVTTSQTSSSALSSTSTSATKISVAPLAPKASPLCATPPTSQSLTLRMDTPGAPAVNPGDVALQAINENAQGADGPFTLAAVDNTTVVEPVVGSSSTGTPLTYAELYFSANGAVPASVKNVEVCTEIYDATAGQVLSADFSGTNTAGPQQGAYDASPEAYVTSGTKKWYTISFNFSGIAFQSGGSGIGKENGGADFRIDIQPPVQQGAVYFKRMWLVTQNVPTKASLSSEPGGSAAVPLSSTATSSTTTAVTIPSGLTDVHVSLAYDSLVMLKPGQTVSATVSHNACRHQVGATFDKNRAINDTGAPTGDYTPKGLGVTFLFPPLSGNDAVCVGTDKPSITIPVPSGKYSAAYFLASANNGPVLTDVTPVYSTGSGTALPMVVNDWCTVTTAVNGKLAPNDLAAGFVGGPWIHSKDGAVGKIPCQYFTVVLQGLNPAQTLTALDLSTPPAGTMLPSALTGSLTGAAQGTSVQVIIGALTLGAAKGG